MEIFSLLVVGVVVFLGFFLLFKSRKSLPPGPFRFPIIGTLLHKGLKEITLDYGMRLKQEYGDIVYTKVGQQEVIYLNSYDVIKETLIEKPTLYSGRSKNPALVQINFSEGILASDGSLWSEHRRFSLRVLRDFGFARSRSQEICQEECQYLVQHIRNHENKAIDTTEIMAKVVANVISSMCFGERSGTDDSDFSTYLDDLQILTQSDSIADRLFIFFPMMKYVPGINQLGVEKRKNTMERIYKYINKKIAFHKATISEDDDASPRDYLDAFLFEQRRLLRGPNAEQHTFTDRQLLRVLAELFAAGTDTTANTLRWSMLLAAVHPEHQTKLYEEVDRVVGRNRSAQPSDRPQLHYVMAFLEEVQRWSTLVPLSVPHRAMQDTELRGFFISKDAIILPNIYAVHHDPIFFPEPYEFRPSRFLKDGAFLTNEHVIPFSVGKRSCLGESLARMELLMFWSTIIQNFQLSLEKNLRSDELEKVLHGGDGLIHTPGKHKILFQGRK